MSMRKLIHELLTADEVLAELVPATQWFAPSAVVDPPTRPFAVIQMSISGRGATKKPGAWSLTIHFHDDPGSYIRIDDCIKRTIDILGDRADVRGSDGAYLSQADWLSTSPDLFDDGHRTITKNTSFQLVGRD